MQNMIMLISSLPFSPFRLSIHQNRRHCIEITAASKTQLRVEKKQFE
jgi:hypothetical protein